MRNIIGKLSFGVFVSLVMMQGYSHEPWLMTPQQLQILKEKPVPNLFNSLNVVNVSLVCFILVILSFIHILNFYLKNNSNVLRRSQKIEILYGRFVPDILRIMTAGTLIIAAFGLIPQSGYPLWTPTLLLPDIHINNAWLKWIQVLLAGCLLIGAYIRFQGIVLIILTLIACYLYPKNMWLYAGYFIGIGLYLILEGAGKIAIVQNGSSSIQKYYSKFALQILTGGAFVLSGVYKVIYPNIDIQLLIINRSFTFLIPYDVFALLMALVEISIGILIVTGPFLRITSLLLFPLFIYLSYILNENVFAHLFLYGILISFIINGSYNK